VDKYGTKDNDPLCYPNSRVLKNLLGIEDEAILADAERDITEITASQIDFQLPPYNMNYLRQLHKALFGDIYAWAGEIRSVDISKGDTHFCNLRFIEAEANKIFLSLQEDNYLADLERSALVRAAAECYGDINMLHPFREGNGRVQRILFEHLIVNAGYQITWQGVSKSDWLRANICAVNCDYGPMSRIFEHCIGGFLSDAY